MSKIKKIMYVLLLSSFTSLITCCIYIFADNRSVELIGSSFYLFDMLFVTLIEAFIIVKFSNQKMMWDRPFIKILKLIAIKFIMMITSILILMLFTAIIEKTIDIFDWFDYDSATYIIFSTILAFVMYFVKILLSFSLIICVTSGTGLYASIKRSTKFALKNIKVVLCYNILFITFLYASNFLVKLITDIFIKVKEFDFKVAIALFLSAMFMELVNYIILITNLKIYLKHKETISEENDDINEVNYGLLSLLYGIIPILFTNIFIESLPYSFSDRDYYISIFSYFIMGALAIRYCFKSQKKLKNMIVGMLGGVIGIIEIICVISIVIFNLYFDY